MGRRLAATLGCAVVFLALVVATAVASGVATTKHATSIKAKRATLHGVVGAGTRSAWLFEYGTTPLLASQTRPRTTKSGTASVKAKVRHLLPDTTYFFRLVVIQGGYIGNATYGSILSFTTK